MTTRIRNIISGLCALVLLASATTIGIKYSFGYYAKGGPAGVGVAVGRAIRLSIVAVVLLNLLLSLLFWGGGNTVKIAG